MEHCVKQLVCGEPSLPMQVESSMAMAAEALPDVQILLSLFLFVWSSLPSSSPLPVVVRELAVDAAPC